jgi:WD40 repeat protein
MTAPLPHRSGVKLAMFSPDSRRVLTATRDGAARVWDARTGMPITPLMKQGGEFYYHGIVSMSFSPDGHRIVIADDSDFAARVWNADTGTAVTQPLRHSDQVEYAIFSHDGRYVATTGRDKIACVWDAATGQPITPPFQHKGAVYCPMFTTDDHALKIVCQLEGIANGIIEAMNLAPDHRPADELVALAQQLSIRRLDESGALVPLDFEALTNTSWTIHQ